MKEVERKLKAVANKRRLAVIKFLDQQTEASVGEIANQIRLSFKSTSRHLAILSAADMVDKEQRGRIVYYRLAMPKTSLIKLILTLI